ncbi:hypothetical protein ACFRI7_11650 [Streptomyces sp. NPDC056716]|uniref:hypothetical protein n=1 Tax=unclassified Streptomyces TaxID=2593676 RepID=UPI0036A43B79
MPDQTASAIGTRIEDLYGRPLAELRAHAAATPPGMLSALLDGLSDLQFTERRIGFERDRLRQLADPERTIGRVDAGHVLDCARRLAEAVAGRDALAQTLTAVLGGLQRIPEPEAPPPAPAPDPIPEPPRVPAAPTR